MAISPHTQELIARARAAQAARQALLRKDTITQTPPRSGQVYKPEQGQEQSAQSQQATQAPAMLVQSTYKPVFAHLPQFASPAGLSLNNEQLKAKDLALQGKSICLIGAAGTGKTTVTQDIISSLQRAAHVSPISDNTKHLTRGAPGIVIVGYTNKAVNNIKRKLPEHLQSHCITIHKLIEFGPVWYEVEDPLTNSVRNTMRFEPFRNMANPLPPISTLIVEESSMVGTDLWTQLMEALPNKPQIIMLGDLNQLPPVFGPSILGFKLGELETVELTQVYRQALLSPIISLATAIRTNAVAFGKQLRPWNETEIMTLPNNLREDVVIDAGSHGKLTIKPWKKRIHERTALGTIIGFLNGQIDQGLYDPATDMLLCPFNKSFGTIEINKGIAQHISSKAGQPVHEVIARDKKTYWAVGDKVMVDRHEAIITEITPQPGYLGKVPRPASLTMNRSGEDSAHTLHNPTADDILNQLHDGNVEDDDAVNRASHIIKVYIEDTDTTQTLSTAGEINSLIFGYCLTVHKSQGSEWRKVYVLLHNSHQRGPLLSRELVYTAVTRARQELFIICEGDIAPYQNSLALAAARPVIPGTTLKEKIEYFNSKRGAMGMPDA